MHFNLVVLCRFTMPTGSRSVMGPVEESSALVAIKLLSPGTPPPPAPSLSVPPAALCTSVILTTRQDIHTERYNRARRRERERGGGRETLFLVFILHPPRSSGCFAYPTRIISHLGNMQTTIGALCIDVLLSKTHHMRKRRSDHILYTYKKEFHG